MTPHPLSRRAETTRRVLRWLMVAIYLFAGAMHVLRPQFFMRIVPPWVPYPHETVVLTGVCELAGAVALGIPRLRWIAGIMLALYAVGVYPANVKHALDYAHSASGWSGWLYHGPRLLFQPVFVWWALFAGKVVDWPFGPRRGRVAA